jgi:hypothetical protein
VRRDTRKTIELVCAGASLVLAAVTAVWSEWIEAIFRVDPDARSGAFEWLVVAALLAVAVVLGRHARRRPALES